MQLELEYNGVAIIGSRLRQINYSNDVTSVESLYVCGNQHTWLQLAQLEG